MSDNISNDAYTTVDGNQTDSTTTLTVLDTSNFPAGSFHISVQNPKKLWGEAVTSGEGEIMLASVSDATTLSVTRSQGGTSAIALTDGWAVYQSMTNRIFDQKADLEGSTSQAFNVATATANEHATRKEQVALLTGGADANFTGMPQLNGTALIRTDAYTPVLEGTTGSLGSYNASTAVGDFLEIQLDSGVWIMGGFDIVLTDKGSWTGSAIVSLPDVPNMQSDFTMTGSVRIANVDLDAAKSFAQMTLLQSSGAYARFLEQGDNTSSATILMADIANNSLISGTFSFKT